MRALAALLALASCATPLPAPAGITLPVAPGWKIRVLTGGLHVVTPLLTVTPRANGVLGGNLIMEF